MTTPTSATITASSRRKPCCWRARIAKAPAPAITPARNSGVPNRRLRPSAAPTTSATSVAIATSSAWTQRAREVRREKCSRQSSGRLRPVAIPSFADCVWTPSPSGSRRARPRAAGSRTGRRRRCWSRSCRGRCRRRRRRTRARGRARPCSPRRRSAVERAAGGLGDPASPGSTASIGSSRTVTGAGSTCSTRSSVSSSSVTHPRDRWRSACARRVPRRSRARARRRRPSAVRRTAPARAARP